MNDNSKSGKRKKPSYGTPVIIPLGELVRGSGNCSPGSAPSSGGGQCKSGITADGQCAAGTIPAKKCNTGSTD